MSFKSLKNILEETMKSEGFMYHMYRITQALPKLFGITWFYIGPH